MNNKYQSLLLPEKNHDAVFENELKRINPAPVFIMGLHRSGTTTLYQTLVDMLPVAGLTIYDIVYYDHLMSVHNQGTTKEYQDRLDAFFRRAGMATRMVDAVALSHQTVEEYGWLLKERRGKFVLCAETAAFFRQLSQKLHYLNPEAAMVLLKNPWDTGRALDIFKRYPEARFIFIKRDPLAVLNSQFRNTVLYAAENNPYLNLLIRNVFGLKLVVALARTLYRIIGKKWYRSAMIRVLKNGTIKGFDQYGTAVQHLPKSAFVEIRYETYIADPQNVLKKIADFLELPITGDLGAVKARPRKQTLLPEVQKHKTAFLTDLTVSY